MHRECRRGERVRLYVETVGGQSRLYRVYRDVRLRRRLVDRRAVDAAGVRLVRFIGRRFDRRRAVDKLWRAVRRQEERRAVDKL
jgi:hypothetical protein